MYYAYLLKCSDNSLYCGITNDLDKRLKAHNAGTASKYTRVRRPVEMIYTEECGTKSDALKREIAIKKLTREQKLELAGV